MTDYDEFEDKFSVVTELWEIKSEQIQEEKSSPYLTDELISLSIAKFQWLKDKIFHKLKPAKPHQPREGYFSCLKR